MADEYWVKNRTSKDLVSSELNLKIPAGKPVNLFKLNPNLTHEVLAKSEASGFIFKTHEAQKLVKLVNAPVKQQLRAPNITESKKFAPTRRRSAIVIDPKQNNFIEELGSFDEAVAAGYDEDGFSDPIRQVIGQDGERFGEEQEPFSATVVSQAKSVPEHHEGNPVKTKRAKEKAGEILVHLDE